MADAVHAAMNPDQATSLQAPADHARRRPQGCELRRRDQPVLARGDPSDSAVDLDARRASARFRTQWVRQLAFVGHAPTMALNPTPLARGL
jgi:hypothetical protein